MADQATHGMAVAGGGSTAAGDTTIGQITLPAGGPWEIHQVWSLMAAATATAAEKRGGHFRLSSVSGDLEPNPAPSRFPTGIISSYLGATAGQAKNPLQIFDVNYIAQGKAVIDLIYNNATAVTVADQVALGIVFGKQRAEKKPIKFIDRVRAQIAAAADTAIGTLTLSEGATRIIGVACIAAQDGVLTTAEELIGFFRMASDDVPIVPAQFPLSAAFSAGLGALIDRPSMVEAKFIPVDIPVPGGARIDCFLDLNTALTNAAEVEVFVAYE